MRRLLLAVAFTMLAAPVALTAAADSAATAPEPERYSTADTDIGTLLDDPAARAILDKYIPAFSKSPRNDMIRSASLKSIQGYALQVLTDKVLADIDAELVKLTPMPRPPGSVATLPKVTTNEARVRPYTLPDPLVLLNGKPVRDAKTWWRKRRPEIYAMFETQEFGRAPGRPASQHFEVFDQGTPALGGKAIRKQVMIHLSKDPAAPAIQLLEYLPAAATKPVPMLLMIGFVPPAANFDDPGIRKSMIWDPNQKQRVPVAGFPMGKLNIDEFLDAGIGVATFYYGDTDPDFPGGYSLGIRARYAPGDEAGRAPDAWGSIAAWAWSLSRVQDYLETDRAVDARRVAINGASRLGKTVLWAAASDQRFAAVTACCSGKMGAALMRRNFGSSIGGSDAGGADYWVAANFIKYYNHEDQLPMDSHMLLALIAPRPVFLQTGKYDHAGDPRGEFLAAVAAGPVYRLLGKQDLGTTAWPPSAPILNDIGYYMNNAGHGMAPGDWDVYLAFLKKHLHPERR
jgi:hypothetical protein